MVSSEKARRLLELLEGRYARGEISTLTYEKLRAKYGAGFGLPVERPARYRVLRPSRGVGRKGAGPAIKIGIALIVIGLILLGLGGGYRAIEQWVSGESSGVQTTAVDAVMVLDVSGSMGDSADTTNPLSGTKIAVLRESAEKFVDELDQNDRVALIAFETNVHLKLGFTSLAQKSTIVSTINGLTADGSTSLWDGAGNALDLINAGARPDAQVVTVLLTDGKNNDSENAYDNIASYAAASGVPCKFYSVGVGTQVDENELKDLSARTGGQYWQVTNATQLPQVFTQIAQTVTVPTQPKDQAAPLLLIACGAGLVLAGAGAIAHDKFKKREQKHGVRFRVRR